METLFLSYIIDHSSKKKKCKKWNLSSQIVWASDLKHVT